MKYSPAELSYLKESLKASPPIRPDARLETQLRPIEAISNILPTANGSARIRASDGGECIVGVKAKVVPTSSTSELINVDVEISGLKENNSLASTLSSIFQSTLNSSQSLRQRLKLTSRFSFKLFIDVLVLSNQSHPLGLVSLTIYLALLSTKLPLLTSSTDDSKAEEVPVFHDDWDQARPLCDIPVTQSDSSKKSDSHWTPPLILLMAVVGENIFIDPTNAEEQVASTGLFISWSNGSISAPLRTLDIGSTDPQGISSTVLSKAYSIVEQCGQEISDSLTAVYVQDEDASSSDF
ncbi:Rrp42p [Sugiyamaella lignohabitans]|uniref:Ribosomal RNA-processing protein 42 n=1 Tax=Sugiyamaella lignohabitans TaxID=796027 RepID=A0A167DLB6_9ASCO|nr:Rrp42p [Sugiyamaella lignohabitans]ANB13038.1 Rrp42p [Sugiyamaella lignohabitans]